MFVVIEEVCEGVREREVVVKMEYVMKMEGVEKIVFDMIIVSGWCLVFLYGVVSDKRIERGEFVVIDEGVFFNYYYFDMMRIVVVGLLNEK